jgi:hypothetical protein
LSTHARHALAALGTDGGQPCADGDLLGRGIHLLWSIRPELGFPRDGYHVWRRMHRPPEWSCFNFEDALDPPPESSSWTWLGYRLEASAGPIELLEFACGELPGLHLPGDRTLMVWAATRSIGVRASGSGAPPLVDVFVADGDGVALAAQRRARPHAGVASVLLAYVPRLPSSDRPAGLGLVGGSVRMTPGTNRRLRIFATTQIVFIRAACGCRHASRHAHCVADSEHRL